MEQLPTAPPRPPRRRTYGDPAISGRLALPGVPGALAQAAETVCLGRCRAGR
jgi:hypothetical protein